jgi:hypothetical protein
MAKITLPMLEELTRKLFHEESKREFNSLNKDDEALFVKFKKFCQNFKKERKFACFKSHVEKKSLTNCKNYKKYGHWAKNRLIPYENVMKN